LRNGTFNYAVAGEQSIVATATMNVHWRADIHKSISNALHLSANSVRRRTPQERDSIHQRDANHAR